jgi:uncharacterized protein (DUF983 family)
MPEHNSFPMRAALRCKCPRCGEGPLFEGFLKLAPACDRCGLDYKFIDAGDGPAVFVVLLAGCLVLGGALWVEVTYEPPFWVHLVIFLPLTVAVCLGMLRPFKSAMVALQYHNKAEEGRLDR